MQLVNFGRQGPTQVSSHSSGSGVQGQGGMIQGSWRRQSTWQGSIMGVQVLWGRQGSGVQGLQGFGVQGLQGFGVQGLQGFGVQGLQGLQGGSGEQGMQGSQGGGGSGVQGLHGTQWQGDGGA